MTILSDVVGSSALSGVLGGVLGGGVLDGDVVSSIASIFLGDSLAEQLAGASPSAEFIAETGAGGVTSTVLERGVGGAKLPRSFSSTEFWWNDLTDSAGAYYASQLDGLVDKATYTDMFISLGTNDTSFIIDTLSKAEWKTAFQQFIAYIETQFVNVERFYLRPLGRHVSLAQSTNGAKWQAIREAIDEIIDENANCYAAAETYDLTITDTVHLTPADRLIEAERLAARVLNVTGRTGTKALPPEISSAEITDDGLILNLTHSDGSDITVPASVDVSSLFYLENDSTAIDLSGVTLERIDATTLKLKCGLYSEINKFGLGYGTMEGIAADVAPVFPYDNSTLELPIKPKSIIPTDTDIIRSLDDLEFYVTPDSPKTLSGSNVLTITDINDTTFNFWASSSKRAALTPNLFGTKGGYRFNNSNARLSKPITMTEGMMFGGVNTCRGSSGNNILRFGTGSSPSPNYLYYFNGGLFWYRNSANAIVTLDSGYNGVSFAWVINVKSNTAMEIYINDGATPIVAEFDPLTNLTSLSDVLLGTSTDMDMGMAWGKQGAHGGGDPSIVDIIDKMKLDYGIA